MRVLMITQKLDPADPLLGFTVGWVRALLSRVQRLDVLCLEEPPFDRLDAAFGEYPPNLRTFSMGKERGFGRLRVARRFYRVLFGIMGKTDVIFSHMVPRYTWMAAPVAMAYPVPQVLWYTHRQVSFELKLALAAARRVATAVPESFPIASPKVRALGHGIDADFFAPDPSVPRDDPPLVVQVGRIMPIKHQHILLRALAKISDQPARVAIVGAVAPGTDPGYLDYLRQLAADLGIAERVHFAGGLPPAGVVEHYRRATVAVNLSPDGLFDKAALESMMTGTPTVVSSAAFDPLLGEHAAAFRINGPEDEDGLANRLADVLDMAAGRRAAIAQEVRARAVAAHSLDQLADRLVDLLAEVANVAR